MTTTSTQAPLLETDGLCVGYGPVSVVQNLNITVRAGEVVALLGPNGAGKSTTLLALAGELPPQGGTVRWRGEEDRTPLHRKARAGLGFVPEERSVVASMTARQNLRIGKVDPAVVVELFPELESHLDRRAGLLSGGQQQILTLARILARKPYLLLADELSLGLAPQVVTRLLGAVRAAADNGLGVLLVEQHVRKALEVADRVYFLQQGRVTWSGTAAEARENREALEASYLSGSAGQSSVAISG
jgi:branched-chain amino acid transport system ATP-binding protein